MWQHDLQLAKPRRSCVKLAEKVWGGLEQFKETLTRWNRWIVKSIYIQNFNWGSLSLAGGCFTVPKASLVRGIFILQRDPCVLFCIFRGIWGALWVNSGFLVFGDGIGRCFRSGWRSPELLGGPGAHTEPPEWRFFLFSSSKMINSHLTLSTFVLFCSFPLSPHWNDPMVLSLSNLSDSIALKSKSL